MSEAKEEPAGRVEESAKHWAAFIAVGTAALYVFGYLSLRFKLAALGVSTDLSALDERYLFAGAQFLINLAAAIPNLLVLAGMPVAFLWGASRLVPRRWRTAFVDSMRPVLDWLLDPTRLALAGVLLSLTLIQGVMRKPFRYHDLLLAPSLPDRTDRWQRQLLLASDDLGYPLYMAGLIAGTAATAGLLLAASRQLSGTGRRLVGVDIDAEPTLMRRGLCYLLGYLVLVQVLLLPINHGVIMAGSTFSRVAAPNDQLDLKEDGEAWLVWEGDETVTYLVRNSRPDGGARRLVSLRRDEVEKIEIIGSEPILRTLFLSEAGPRHPAENAGGVRDEDVRSPLDQRITRTHDDRLGGAARKEEEGRILEEGAQIRGN